LAFYFHIKEESCLLPNLYSYELCHGCADALMSGQPVELSVC